MNTRDINCVKMPEQSNKYSQNQYSNTELEPLYVINDINRDNWYNRVYLCYEDVSHNYPNDSLPIKGFNCYRYNSFVNADAGWNRDVNKLDMNIRVTMIPMCKWVPPMFDRLILNWKLRNMYWLGKHTLRQGYNRFSNKK